MELNYEDAVMVLKTRLLQIRAVRGWSAELARRSGADKSTVSEWCAGKYLPGVGVLPHIAAILGLTMFEFFDLSVPAKSPLKGVVNALPPPSISPQPGAQDWIADAIVALIAPLDQTTRSLVLARALSEIVNRATGQQSSSGQRTGRDSVGALHASRHRTA
jgi:transcriptional regulator with XRE-family HTH domain